MRELVTDAISGKLADAKWQHTVRRIAFTTGCLVTYLDKEIPDDDFTVFTMDDDALFAQVQANLEFNGVESIRSRALISKEQIILFLTFLAKLACEYGLPKPMAFLDDQGQEETDEEETDEEETDEEDEDPDTE